MSYFNIENYKGNYCMHCKTKEEAKNFCKYLDSVGKKWSSGDSYLSEDNFDIYKSDTVYFFNEGTYDKMFYAKSKSYTILEWSNFMQKTFSKADLENGMVVEYANGDRKLVVGDKIMSQNGFMLLKDYGEDLTFAKDKELNINRVYKSYGCNFNTVFRNDYLELVWERSQEYTLKELEKIFGCKIKIVPEKDD